MVDALAALYSGILNVDPENPHNPDRDYLVCSKGHAGPALYATLAIKGFFPMDWLLTLNQHGTRLPSHCDRLLTPGIDATTGSLGQGISLAVGAAHGLKIKGSKSRVYSFTGDGELNEGQVWEAAMYAAHYKLNNLIVMVDRNKKQLDGYTEDIMALLDIEAKYKSFGWYAITAQDGNDSVSVKEAIEKAKSQQGDKPAAIILETTKGAGVPELEEIFNHHIPLPTDLYDRSIKHLNNLLATMN
jgi:transketolase